MKRVAFGLIGLMASVSAMGGIPDGDNILVEAENCGRVTATPCGGPDLVAAGQGGTSLRIHVTVLDENGDPVAFVPATDMWLWHPGLVVCSGGAGLSHADAQTSSLGETQFSGPVFGGVVKTENVDSPCSIQEMHVVVQGVTSTESCCVGVDSPDLNGSGSVTVGDFGLFGLEYNDPSGSVCCDYNEDGEVTAADFGIFGGYFPTCECP